MQSIFSTQPTVTPTQAPPAEPPAEETKEPTTETTQETTQTPEETTQTPTVSPDMITLPDGTQMSQKAYVDLQVAQLKAENGVTTTPPAETPAETPTDPPWKLNIDDPDVYQSDIEKNLVDAHNKLGEEVTQTLGQIAKQVETVAERTAREQTDRQIQEAERKYGVTEAEMVAVYNEYGRSVEEPNALAEIAASRKSSSEQSEERTREASEERKSQATTVSGGGAATPTGQTDETPGRGLSGKDIYSGAAIAAKYKAF